MFASIIAIVLGMGGQVAPVPSVEELTVRRVGGTFEVLRSDGHVIHTTTARVGDARLIRLGSSSGQVATWTETSGRTSVPFFGVSLTGGEFERVAQADNKIHLRYAPFDPAQSVPTVPAALKASRDSRAYIVQFVSQTLDEYRAAIRSVGGEIYNYLPSNAYICNLSAEGASALRQLPFVRYVGFYEPAYRIDEGLRASLASGKLGNGRYFIQMLGDDVLLKRATAFQLSTIGAIVESAPDEGILIEAYMTPGQLVAAAHLDGIMWIEPWSAPEPDMDNVRIISGANYINTFGTFRGQGVNAHVIDGGVRATHQAFAGRLTVRSNSTSTSHGTSTTGCVGGSGAANAAGTGMMPDCQLVFSVYSTSWTTAQRLALTQDTVNVHQCVVESNSWGNPQTTEYTSVSAQMDEIIFKTDLTILNSQSNTGNQNSRPQAWAKNIVSIGGISHYNNAILSDDQWTSASIGPAADGRLKPDMSFYYDSILCPSSTSDTSYTTSFGGTSAATPMTAGAFGLFHEMWHKGLFFNTAMGSTVFQNRPKATLAKAWMIASARQYSFSGTGHNLSRYKQGWGLPDLQKIYDMRNRFFWINETDILQNLQTKTYRIFVPAGTPQLNVTLAYNDYWGTTSATQHRINAVGVRVIGPTGTNWYGNNGLAAGNFSTSGGTWNLIDNVQCVILNAPASGIYTIEVRANEVNVDGHVETPEVDVDYSLVVLGGAPWAAHQSVATTFGVHVGGGLDELLRSDNLRYRVREAPPVALGGPNVTVETTLAAPTNGGTLLEVGVEHRATAIGVTGKIFLFNVTQNKWDEVSSQVLTGADVLQTATVTTNVNDYINSSGNTIRVRTSYFGSAAASIGWNAEIDQVRVHLQP